MVSKTVILVTSSYPFGKGEQFLDTELKYLSKRLDRIIVFPQSAAGLQRNTPDKVIVDLSLTRPKNKLRYLVETFIRGVTSSYLYAEIARKSFSILDPRKTIRTIQYVGIAARARDQIQLYVEGAGINLNSTVFYTYWLSSASLGIGLLKLKYPLIKLISRAHGGDIYEDQHSPAYLPFRKNTLDCIDQIYCISEHGKRYLTNLYPSVMQKCVVSRLGVDDPGVLSRASTEDNFCLVSCSFLIPLKRIQLLILGLRLLSLSSPKLRIAWHHFGDGPQRNYLEKLAKNSLPNPVKCNFHGQITNAEIYEFYKSHPVDAFVNVSKSEGIPVSIMEAQSFGIPVIAPMVGGIPEIINDQNGILLVSNPTAQDISSALWTLANDRSISRRSASKQTWKKLYNAENNYNKFGDDLIQILNEIHLPIGKS